MSSSSGIGSTLTGGIQDIAAILPLLGTEQCSEQVSSALTRGYLYTAATPMSIFGSLGVVSAGFKTLIACFSFGGIEGAKILGNIGFEPQGENLSLIMVEVGNASKGKDAGRYIIETRIDELIQELNIDKNRITGVSHKSITWNVQMIAATALLCAISITPYIYLNLGANDLNKTTRWVFPVLRATGGFITATLIQLLIQRRITTLSDQYLKYLKQDQMPEQEQQRNTDVEAAGDMKKCRMVARRIAPTWLLLCILLIGLLASVAGYVGCFSVVQNSISSTGPVSWLCLESGLSVMRVALWAWNPRWDDAPPLEFILKLDERKHSPLPTCNKDNEEILEHKVLPLTRAEDFLKIITSFAGLIEPFSNPDLSLYYTLTRKHPSRESLPGDDGSERDDELEKDDESVRDNEMENAESHKLGERMLYITVFDHKERTTRVYTQDDEREIFYSTKSDAPLVDVGHFLLEVEIDAKIDAKGDPVSRDNNNLDSLRNHHRSILEYIQYRLGAGDVATKSYAIENSWTMKVEDTISTFQRLREENRADWNTVVEKGKEEERNEESSPICNYFMYASIERKRRLLDEKRVEWIARRMEMITTETKERLQGETEAEYRVNKEAAEEKPALATKSPDEIALVLTREQYLMEMLLLYEVNEWEEFFWKKFKAFLDQIGNDRVEVKDRWRTEWRTNCWKRLNPLMHAAVKRLPDYYNEWLEESWASSISQLFEGFEQLDPISLFKLNSQITTVANDEPEMGLRMEKEIEDVHFRLKRGSDLGHFDPSWDGDLLFNCRYSRSKWAYLGSFSDVPLEVYLHALKGNKNIVHITLDDSNSDSDVKRLLAALPPWVTSISCDNDSFGRQPAIHRDVLFIKYPNNDLTTFAKEIRLNLDPSSTYIFTEADGHNMFSDYGLGYDARILISFVGPTSGRLILRLKHSGKDGRLDVTLGSTMIQLYPSSKSSKSLIDDITLYPIQDTGFSGSDHFSFEPGIRNDIQVVIQFPGQSLYLHDIELLDEDGLEYRRHMPLS